MHHVELHWQLRNDAFIEVSGVTKSYPVGGTG